MRARVISGEFSVLYEAAKRGLGVTALPEFVCAPAILHGELEVVLPAWSIPQGVAHFVYASRRGLLPSVRAFVDFLAERLPDTMRIKHEQCMKRDDKAV
jgi:DNA-binding transcriptional LysR family regulator